MKAIRIHEFGEPEVMRLEETALVAVSAGHVLVEIKAVGVNPVDTYIRAGWYGPRKFPFTPGFDAAGIVLEVGNRTENITIGQRIFLSGSATGTYALQALCTPSQIYPLPESISFEKGAAIGIPYHTAYRALFQRGCAKKDEIVLVHGASGGVGLATVQLAKTAGVKIIATAGTEHGQRLVKQQGADFVLDHHGPKYLDKAMEFTEGRGVDIILEMLANVNLGNDLPILAKNGRAVVVGSRGSVEINPRDLMSREADVLGVMVNSATQQQRQEAFEAIRRGLENGSLDPVIAMQLPLAQAPMAHREIMEAGHHGKIVLIP